MERRDGDGLVDEYNEDEAGMILELLSTPEPEESNNEAS